MEQKKKLRGSAALKIIAFLLAWALAVCICAGAAGGLYLFGRRQYFRNNDWEGRINYTQVEQAQELFFLSRYKDALTLAGKQRYDELTSALSDKTTNFRFEVSRTSDASVLFTNISKQNGSGNAEGFDITGTIDSSYYENAMSRMLAYYLDMDKVKDWQVETGTPQQWAQTPNASRYYYDDDSYRNVLQEANSSQAQSDVFNSGYEDVDVDVAIEETDPEPEESPSTLDNSFQQAQYEEYAAYVNRMAQEGRQNEIIPMEGYFASQSQSDSAQPEEDSPQFYYFVYTGEDTGFWISYGIDRTYPVEDEYSVYVHSASQQDAYYEEHVPIVMVIGISSLILFLLLLTYLTLAIGWNREGELALRGMNRMPIELALLLGGGLILLAMVFFFNTLYVSYEIPVLSQVMLYTGVAGIPGALGALILWLVAAAQIKTKAIAKRSLVIRFVRWLRKWLTAARHALGRVLLQLPLYWKAAAFWAIYWVLYYLYMFTIGRDAYETFRGLGVLIFGTLPLIPLVIYTCKWALDWARLRKAVQEMVAGHLDYQVNTNRMLPDLKVHGEDLSSLSTGLSRAVDERLKSERFKTELITNVSHDLKTPLTSIINYVDLLKKADIQDETARGYIEVLDRKSQRLKTLTEDLVEASKAASGTIAVQLEKLDVKQLVDQAVAEYDERLSRSQLTTVVTMPETPCMVMADGRHLWRILDNLLGNCTKYAMPGTRVYLDVTKQGKDCVIAVKNISADPLNVPAEELMKRFVRGDSARSTEGSGLGLSIARNLTNAQNGVFDLVVDGDLFKAIVSFPLVEDTVQAPGQNDAQPEQKTE